MRSVNRALLSATLASLALPAFGQGIGAPPDAAPLTALETLNVTAQRLPSRGVETGSAVTVIAPTEIERRGAVEVLDLLKRTPGVSISRTGGFGSVSGLRIRGSDTGQVLVLIDGVRVNDASDVSGAYDFGGLTADGVERIEILRGPQSALYGNDAIGGVVNIITSKGRGKTEMTALAEAGSYQTFRQRAGFSGAEEGLDYALTVAHMKTKGFSRTYTDPEKDGSEQLSLTGRGGYRFNDRFRLGLSGGYRGLDAGYDPSFSQNKQAVAVSKKLFGRVDGVVTLLEGRLENILSLTGSDTDRDYHEPSGFSPRTRYAAKTYGAEYQGNLILFDQDVLTGGLASRADTMQVTSQKTKADDLSQDTRSAFAQYKRHVTEAFTVTLGGRRDEVESFGGKNTYRATFAYRIANTGTLLRASYGTGAKAPTLFQRFSAFGNRSLKLETSKGVDAGVEQELTRNLRISAGVFHSGHRNLIQYQTSKASLMGGSYFNVGRATLRGAEFGMIWNPWADLRLASNYTYLEAEDGGTRLRLPRRPKHTLNLIADYDAAEAWQIGGAMRFVTKQKDNNFSEAKTPASLVVDARTAYQANAWAQVYVRLDNLLNADGRETADYRAPGRSFYLGVRAEF